MEAENKGSQRKVVTASVAPLRRAHGSSGVALRDGSTLPFVVSRSWSAPAGHYLEGWFLVDPGSREVFYEGGVRQVSIRGLQSWTEVRDEVHAPVALEEGVYAAVFSLGGQMGGQIEVEVAEQVAEEVA